MYTLRESIDALTALGATPRQLARLLREAKSPDEPGARFHVEATKLAARLAAPKSSELEKAAKTIAKASRLLSDIIDGNLRDTGTDDDRLAAASIKRHGPGIIISYIQLGVDVHKVYDFYQPPDDLGGTTQSLIYKEHNNGRDNRNKLDR